MLLDNEKLEPLGNDVYVIVSDIHKFSTDTILLADFSSPKKHEKAIDLGTGCGAIPLLWARNNENLDAVAVDIQKDACNMLERSIDYNNLKGKICVLNSDIKDLKGKLQSASYDIISCNPPYKQIGTGIVNPNDAKKIARHEHMCTIDDIINESARLLNFAGRLCMCLRPDRLCDVMESMRKAKIEPKKLRFVQQRKNKPPKLFLIEGKRGANPGIRVLETLFIENDNGGLSDEMIKIYGVYGENKNGR